LAAAADVIAQFTEFGLVAQLLWREQIERTNGLDALTQCPQQWRELIVFELREQCSLINKGDILPLIFLWLVLQLFVLPIFACTQLE